MSTKDHVTLAAASLRRLLFELHLDESEIAVLLPPHAYDMAEASLMREGMLPATEERLLHRTDKMTILGVLFQRAK